MTANLNGQKYTVKETKGSYPWLAEREHGGRVFGGYGNTPQEACEICAQEVLAFEMGLEFSR